jgi:hypothetical protein
MDCPLRFIGAICLFFATGAALADGWTLQDGRFPGKSTIIRLSPEQAVRLDYIHRCRGDNTRTPYVFHLTADQTALVKKQTGVAATRFAVFDSTHGDTSVDLSTNVLVRFAPHMAEIPRQLVDTDQETRKYEQKVMGWSPNPIESATSSQVASGKCPG